MIIANKQLVTSMSFVLICKILTRRVRIKGTNEVILQRRLEILKNLHDINLLMHVNYMQKAKIQWAIEGDENSKFFHGIINRTMATLESPVSRDEVRNAVWGCGENKSPGPDGFSFEFCKFRDTVEIGMASFIINELLSWCKHKKQQAMVFKVDFAKAYDSIRWDFLEDVLTAFGFGPKWCSWIRGCLHFVWRSVLSMVALVWNSILLRFEARRPLALSLFISPWESSTVRFLGIEQRFLRASKLINSNSFSPFLVNLLGVGVRSEYAKMRLLERIP
ncbi:RNA-directed DNA polymerase, eukaryota [Tanacetum coccineum]